MTISPSAVGPDLAIVGAARSGTSFLTAHMAAHPQIDLGSVKEPNFYSRHYDRGADWYDGLYSRRDPSLRRLDASTSYTYPQYPEALARLAASAPEAYVVYQVRDPIERAISHYLYYHYYFRMDQADSFGAALRASSYYCDVSDYGRWLSQLRTLFGDDRLLVVPFDLATQSATQVTSVICRALAIDSLPEDVSAERGQAHRNNVVEFRSDRLRVAMKRIRRNRTYLRVRSTVGPHRVRRVRAMLTRRTALPTVAEALESCDPRQRAELRDLAEGAGEAVRSHLEAQDERLGLRWTTSFSPQSAADPPSSRPPA